MKYTAADANIIRAACRDQDEFDWVHDRLAQAASQDSEDNASHLMVHLLTELLTSTTNIHKLSQISAKCHADSHVLIQDYLALGCRVLQLEIGIVSCINLVDNTYRLEEMYPPLEENSKRDFCDANASCCGHVVSHAKTVAYGMGNPTDEVPRHPLYHTQRLETYLGTPIWVNKKIFGTLNFSSIWPRRTAFKAAEIEFIEIMAHHIGQALYTQQVQQASNDQEAILRLFVKHTPAAIAMFDTEIRYLLTSDRWLSDYGIAGQDLTGRSHYDVFPEIGEDWKDIHRHVLKGHIDKIEEAIFKRANGKTDWIRWEVLPWYRNNVVAGVIMFTEVITKRKEDELALRRSQSLYQSLLDHLPNTGIVTFDHDLRYTLAAGPVLETMGYSQQILGKTIYDVLPAQDHEGMRSLYKAVLEGESFQFEREAQGLHLDSRAVPVYDIDGTILNGLVVIQNITERKRFEQALKATLEEEHEFQSYLKSLHDITIELMQTEELDSFYQCAIKLGSERLGFERLGLFLYDADTDTAVGTYGMDMHRNVLDERHVHFTPSSTGVMRRAFQRTERFAYTENVPLFTSLVPIGVGWNAAAVLWNGTEGLGWLTADNAVSQKPATKPLLEILSHYALTIGTLLASKKTLRALHESEALYRLLAENITDEISQTSPSIEFRYVSPSVKNVLGYAPEELLGTSGLSLVHPDDLVKISALQADENRYRPNVPLSTVTHRVRHKAGHYVWLEANSKALFSTETGELTGFVTSSRDITARKQAEEALQKSTAEIHALYNQAPCGYHSLDPEGMVVQINDTELRWLGYSREELIGKMRFRDLVMAEQAVAFDTQFATFKECGFTSDFQFDVVCKDGGILHLLLNATAIYDETGQFVRSRSTLFDMTQLKEAQDTIQHALEKEKELNELKTRFVSMASHEFRTPLATLLVLAENLSRYRHKMTEEQIEQRVDRIKDQIAYMTELMNDVLELARLQARQTELSAVNLDVLCRTVIEEFQNQPGITQNILYACHLAQTEVQLDRKLMRHAMNNLVSNAVKYSAQGTTIAVELHNAEGNLILTVQDQGIGIPEADLKYLFEPFHRAENVGAIAGTGLGLMITKEAVELQGGTIQVKSQVGVGTTFIITFPVTAVKEDNR